MKKSCNYTKYGSRGCELVAATSLHKTNKASISRWYMSSLSSHNINHNLSGVVETAENTQNQWRLVKFWAGIAEITKICKIWENMSYQYDNLASKCVFFSKDLVLKSNKVVKQQILCSYLSPSASGQLLQQVENSSDEYFTDASHLISWNLKARRPQTVTVARVCASTKT